MPASRCDTITDGVVIHLFFLVVQQFRADRATGCEVSGKEGA
jgi:hypothetical protein